MKAKKNQSVKKTLKSDSSIKDSPKCDKTDQSKSGDTDKTTLPFPVIGIGASAGGLEALQPFFENITTPPGAAFVIIQHLSPDHNSYMVDLLSRHTFLPVAFIEDGMPLEINHVYLIPPKVNITISEGVFHFSAIVGRGLNLPIDIFFLSLAEDQKNNAIALIMSGAGSDGTLGIRAIKEYGGIIMVQDPGDAHFDGMPISALSTNMVDLVLPAGKLAIELVSYLKHSHHLLPNCPLGMLTDNQTLYNRIMSILKEAKKVDFSVYRRDTIIRRLEKRISLNRFDKLIDYVEFLTKTPQEIETLYYEILIGVTRFFRDPEAFALLEKECFPSLFQNNTDGELRVWVASCSTGEEAYSVAILLKEYMLKNHIAVNVKIFATDIDDRSLKFASKGIYPQNVVSDLPHQYLAKYFSPNKKGYQICPDIRNMIIFASQDLISNSPFFKMDLVLCRNFLIYIHPEAQKRVLSSFYVGLKTGGFLFLGPSESLEEVSKGFVTLSSKYKIFRKQDGYTPGYSPSMPGPLHLSMLENLRPEPVGNLTQVNNELLAVLEQIDNEFLPPSLITDADNNIIYAIRDVGNLLHISSGRVSTNLMSILPKEVSLIVSSLTRRAHGRDEIVSSEILFDSRPMNVRCRHIISKNSGVTYYFITFEEIGGGKQSLLIDKKKSSVYTEQYMNRVEELEYELTRQKESLRVAVEQLETSNEELQASNEEMVASNEELQSSNEELQSVNEELYTVNMEHVRKLEEITELNNDYDNLLSNTDVGTLYLDNKLIIRKISKIAGKILDIQQSETGKPLSYFSLRNLYPEFMKDVERVNTSKRMKEKELHLRRKTYCMRIVPYLNEEKVKQGIIITFVDLTDCKMRALREAYDSQEKLRNSAAQLEAAITIARLASFQINVKTMKFVGSRLFSELWPLEDGCVIPFEKWVFPEDLPDVKSRFDDLRGKRIEHLVISFRSKYFGDLRYYQLVASIGENAAGDKIINGVIQNTTHLIETQQRQEAQQRFWDDSINAIPGLFFAKDADDGLRYVFANRYFLDFTGKRLEEVVGKADTEITTSGERYRAEDLQVLQSDDEISFENEATATDGTIRYYHTTKWKTVGVDGHRLIMAIASDVTQQRLMMQDMETANHCLSVMVDLDDIDTKLREIMKHLCMRLGASHCVLMSFDEKNRTTRCEYEFALSGYRPLKWGSYGNMPFSEQSQWYQCYQKNQILDIPDLAATEESVQILEKYSDFPKKFKAQSLYSVSFRNGEVIEGAVCFIYKDSRPELSRERLSYLMSFASNLFRNILFRRQHPETFLTWPTGFESQTKKRKTK